MSELTLKEKYDIAIQALIYIAEDGAEVNRGDVNDPSTADIIYCQDLALTTLKEVGYQP